MAIVVHNIVIVITYINVINDMIIAGNGIVVIIVSIIVSTYINVMFIVIVIIVIVATNINVINAITGTIINY